MSDQHFYKPSAELAAALRDYRAKKIQHVREIVAPFVTQFPDNEPMINSTSERITGFRDGAPDRDPPAGLSRAKNREHLIPVRGSAGDVWRDWIRTLAMPVRKEQVFAQFKVEFVLGAAHRGEAAMFWPNFIDLGDEHGVFVYFGTELAEVPDALTPVRKSAFYSHYEAFQDSRKEISRA